jgi:ankyrin repeat protein
MNKIQNLFAQIIKKINDNLSFFAKQKMSKYLWFMIFKFAEIEFYFGEEVVSMVKPNILLINACKAGNLKLMHTAFEKGANNFAEGLKVACYFGEIDAMNIMIEKCHCDDFNYGLYGACAFFPAEGRKGDQLKIIELLIEKGARDFGEGLNGACEGGNLEIINYMLEKEYRFNYDWALYSACCANLEYHLLLRIDGIRGARKKQNNDNQMKIINLMIEKGANDFTWGLRGACLNGNIEIVNFMIEKGANNFDEGLYTSSIRGHLKIIDLMIEKGTTNFNYGLRGACYGGQLDIIEMMIEKGANDFNEGLRSACSSFFAEGEKRDGRQIEAVRMMIKKGAKNIKENMLMCRDKEVKNYLMTLI